VRANLAVGVLTERRAWCEPCGGDTDRAAADWGEDMQRGGEGTCGGMWVRVCGGR
jgi:hypothetical protein